MGQKRDRRGSFPDTEQGPLEKGVLQEEEMPRGAATPGTSEGVVSSPATRGRSWERIALGAG